MSAPNYHLHVDGGLYALRSIAQSSEDQSSVAVYEHLFPFAPGVWTRPLGEFEKRFERIDEAQAQTLLAMDPATRRQAITEAKSARRAKEASLGAAPISVAPRSRLHCLGFMLSMDSQRVALIRKVSPAWQAGKLNGIGGKAEIGETARQAMAREFHEEAGTVTDPHQWECFARIGAAEFEVYAYRIRSDQIDELQTMTAEEVIVLGVHDPLIDEIGLSGLGALVRCAIDSDPMFVRFDYRDWAHEAKQGIESIVQM